MRKWWLLCQAIQSYSQYQERLPYEYHVNRYFDNHIYDTTERSTVTTETRRRPRQNLRPYDRKPLKDRFKNNVHRHKLLAIIYGS